MNKVDNIKFTTSKLKATMFRENYIREAAAAGTLFGLGIINPVVAIFGIPFFIAGAIDAYKCHKNIVTMKESFARVK